MAKIAFVALIRILFYYISYEAQEVSTPLCPKDKELIEELKSAGYTSWADWEEDYLYYIEGK